MNQERIGKFIAKCRKNKKLTQQELAEKLGVSDRTIGNWENGRNMPDLSLFKPLCNELGISINELISGNEIKKEEYQEKFEENIINTIDYSSKTINKKNKLIGEMLLFFGLGFTFTAFSIFKTDSSWGSIYSIFGVIVSLIGVARITKGMKYVKRLSIHFGYFVLMISILLILDYSNVVLNDAVPRFAYLKEYSENMIIYKAPFYNVYRINVDTKNEYYIVDTKKEYTADTIPIVPFNRNKSGIDNIIEYKNKYVGNNSNDSNLISNLPLSEYGYVFEIDTNNLGLIINYHITDWYINENYYLEKCLIYNSISIFSLIDNVEYIDFSFSGKTYHITRKQVEDNYPNYNEIIKDGLNKEYFNEYLENLINDEVFMENIFNKFFSTHS